jgi:hypothetical protein
MDEKAHIYIKIAWISGIFWILCSSFIAALSYLLLYIPVVSPFTIFVFIPFLGPILNVLIVTFLVIGLYKNNPVCAVILFLHVISYLVPSIGFFIFRLIEGSSGIEEFWYLQLSAYVVLIVFTALLYLGVHGTFTYNKATKSTLTQ